MSVKISIDSRLRLYSDLSSWATCRRLWVGALTWLSRGKLAICEVSFPCTARVGCLCRDRKVGDMADASQSFTTKPIGPDGCQVFEGLELGSREPFTENWQIVSLSC